MNSVSISGYGDDLSVNGIRIGDLTPDDHEQIEKEKKEAATNEDYVLAG